jgi:hypothetical protein
MGTLASSVTARLDPSVLKGHTDDGLTLSLPLKHANAASLVGQPEPAARSVSTP